MGFARPIFPLAEQNKGDVCPEMKFNFLFLEKKRKKTEKKIDYPSAPSLTGLQPKNRQMVLGGPKLPGV